MNLLDLKKRVRSYTRDFSNSIFREDDIIVYINEGIERLQQVIPELADMQTLSNDSDEVQMLPKPYHHLLAVYASFRCYAQDERHYQAGNFGNEFEVKVEELKQGIENGSIIIKDALGNAVELFNATDYVRDEYFVATLEVDLDEGV